MSIKTIKIGNAMVTITRPDLSPEQVAQKESTIKSAIADYERRKNEKSN